MTDSAKQMESGAKEALYVNTHKSGIFPRGVKVPSGGEVMLTAKEAKECGKVKLAEKKEEK